MEEMHRTHKDVPFGWFGLVLNALARRPTVKPRPTTRVPAPLSGKASRGCAV